MSKGDALGLLYGLANVHFTCIAVFIRCRFGSEALGWNGLGAFLLLICLAASQPGMGWYFLAWLVMQIYRRVETLRMWMRGQVTHSRYAGDPWLAMRIPFCRDDQSARAAEPLLCFALGAVLLPLSQCAGGLVMAGLVSATVRNIIEELIDRKRIQAMRDAEIEASYYGRRLRGR